MKEKWQILMDGGQGRFQVMEKKLHTPTDGEKVTHSNWWRKSEIPTGEKINFQLMEKKWLIPSDDKSDRFQPDEGKVTGSK